MLQIYRIDDIWLASSSLPTFSQGNSVTENGNPIDFHDSQRHSTVKSPAQELVDNASWQVLWINSLLWIYRDLWNPRKSRALSNADAVLCYSVATCNVSFASFTVLKLWVYMVHLFWQLVYNNITIHCHVLKIRRLVPWSSNYSFRGKRTAEGKSLKGTIF